MANARSDAFVIRLSTGVAVQYHLDGTFSLLPEGALGTETPQLRGNDRLASALLAGCITAGLVESSCGVHNAARATLDGYLFSLVVNYHTTRATSELFPILFHKLAKAGHSSEAALLQKKWHEERGHWLLAKQDLDELKASDLLLRKMPDRALEVTGLLHHLASSDDPIGVLGYSYVLERMALAADTAQLDLARTVLPEGSKATRCLTAHSTLGAEPRHVELLLQAISLCRPSAILVIAEAAFATAKAMSRRFADEEKLRLESIYE